MDAFERAIELTPILGELGWEERRSFNGLLSVTVDSGSIIGESVEARNLWLCEAVWGQRWSRRWQVVSRVDDAWPYEHGSTQHRSCASLPHPKKPTSTSAVTAMNHRRRFIHLRYIRVSHLRHLAACVVSPFYERESLHSAVTSWRSAVGERAHGYAANEETLAREVSRSGASERS